MLWSRTSKRHASLYYLKSMEPDYIIESIKRTARELFRQNGYHKTSVNALAKKAKIAKATVYKYFDSKEMILHAILMDYLRASLQDILRTTKYDDDMASFLDYKILRVSRLTYTACNELIGWEFIRESANAQEYLKMLFRDVFVYMYLIVKQLIMMILLR